MFSLVRGASVGPHHRGVCRPGWSPGTEMLELICIGKNGGKKSTLCVESRFFQPDSGRAGCIQHSLSSVPGEVMDKGAGSPIPAAHQSLILHPHQSLISHPRPHVNIPVFPVHAPALRPIFPLPRERLCARHVLSIRCIGSTYVWFCFCLLAKADNNNNNK